jgi:hypothetical protein
MVYAETLRLGRARLYPLLGYYTYYTRERRGAGHGGNAASSARSVVDVLM